MARSRVATVAVASPHRAAGAMPVPVQEALVARLTDQHEGVRRDAGKTLSSAQQQGLRLFLRGAVVAPAQLVSELSVTTSFSDGCHAPRRAVRPSASWLWAT